MDEWHFPRPALAEHYLSLLKLGISSNLAIIAPRRKGKTLFVLKDLAPLAQTKNYIPVYASLWQNINAPCEGLLTALIETIDALDKQGRFNRLLKAKIKKTTISNELLGKMEIEFANNPTHTNNHDLANLERLITVLENKVGEKTILLLIDEVQHLSTSAHFSPLAHTLRTLLDQRQGKIKSICTGSSRHYMNMLFNESQSPFYHFVEPVPFPDFDDTFIAFLSDKMRNDYNLSIKNKDLSNAFLQLDYSPYWMMKLIATMITLKMPVGDALIHIQQLMDAAEGLDLIANKMKQIDKIIFLALCKKKNPYSKALMARIDKETNVKGIAANIQRAIARLLAANLISQIHKGDYYIEKPGLKRFLEKRHVIQ